MTRENLRYETKDGIARITLARPTLRLHQDGEGRWNFQKLLTGRPIRFPQSTDVTIKGARLELDSNRTRNTLPHL